MFHPVSKTRAIFAASLLFLMTQTACLFSSSGTDEDMGTSNDTSSNNTSMNNTTQTTDVDMGEPDPLDMAPPDMAPTCDGPCEDGEECCDGECVDTRSDEANCGGCGMACAGTCCDTQCLQPDDATFCEACGYRQMPMASTEPAPVVVPFFFTRDQNAGPGMQPASRDDVGTHAVIWTVPGRQSINAQLINEQGEPVGQVATLGTRAPIQALGSQLAFGDGLLVFALTGPDDRPMRRLEIYTFDVEVIDRQTSLVAPPPPDNAPLLLREAEILEFSTLLDFLEIPGDVMNETNEVAALSVATLENGPDDKQRIRVELLILSEDENDEQPEQVFEIAMDADRDVSSLRFMSTLLDSTGQQLLTWFERGEEVADNELRAMILDLEVTREGTQNKQVIRYKPNPTPELFDAGSQITPPVDEQDPRLSGFLAAGFELPGWILLKPSYSREPGAPGSLRMEVFGEVVPVELGTWTQEDVDILYPQLVPEAIFRALEGELEAVEGTLGVLAWLASPRDEPTETALTYSSVVARPNPAGGEPTLTEQPIEELGFGEPYMGLSTSLGFNNAVVVAQPGRLDDEGAKPMHVFVFQSGEPVCSIER